MPATVPSLQSLVGAHSGGYNCAVDWTELVCWQLSPTDLSKYEILSGLEIASNTLASCQGTNDNVGVLLDGGVTLTGGTGLYNGGMVKVDGATLAFLAGTTYPAPNFGSGQMTGVELSGHLFTLDRCIGNAVVGVLNRTQCSRVTGGTVVYTDTVGWPGSTSVCQLCADTQGNGSAWQASSTAPADGTQNVVLVHLVFDAISLLSQTTIATIVPTDVDGTWTKIAISGVCMDSTDANVLAVVSGDGAVKSYLIKVDRNSGAVLWTAVVPLNFSADLPVGNLFQYSSVTNSRLALFTNSPAKVTIYDTTDGSVDSTYTAGLAGISQLGKIGGQCYNDALGGIVLPVDFNQVGGSPTLLNSTPTSFNGWSVLYVAVPTPPVVKRRRWLATLGPVEL